MIHVYRIFRERLTTIEALILKFLEKNVPVIIEITSFGTFVYLGKKVVHYIIGDTFKRQVLSNRAS